MNHPETKTLHELKGFCKPCMMVLYVILRDLFCISLTDYLTQERSTAKEDIIRLGEYVSLDTTKGY